MDTLLKDRSAGLIIFGVLTILVGGFCALMVILMILVGFSQQATVEGAASWRSLIPSIITYTVLAIVLIWLGIGSTLKQRWARPLLLMFAWVWLLTGIGLLAIMWLTLPKMLRSLLDASMPGPAEQFVISFTFVVIGFGFVLMPIVWILFYGSRHVKATCEAYHPALSWTDRCPTQVLALSIGLAMGVLLVFVAPFSMNSLFPLFGLFVDGWFGTGLYMLSAIMCAVAAWLTFKLDLRGWWLTLGLTAFFGVSSFLTYWRSNLFEIYHQMGYSENQIASMSDLAFFQGPTLAWITAVASLLMIGYLMYTFPLFKSSSK